MVPRNLLQLARDKARLQRLEMTDICILIKETEELDTHYGIILVISDKNKLL
jgi:hypothetical protein